MNPILKKLTGGDLRSIGRVDEVIADVKADPSLFAVLFDGMLNNDPLIRMRSADAIEKLSAELPELLQAHKNKLINEVVNIEQQEVCWHVAQMLPRLHLNKEERMKIMGILTKYLEHKSKIVRTFSMQALADLSEQDVSLHPLVTKLLEEMTRTGSPAMKSRGQKLLQNIKES